MPDLNEILAKMLTDVRSGAAQRAEKKRKATVKKKEATERPIFEAIRNPWIDESITLLINEYHCSCGAVHTFPNPLIFIERTRLRFGVPEMHQEAVPVSNIAHVYSHLPRRTDVRISAVNNCQTCFTPDQNRFAANQLAFNFNAPKELH